MISHICTTWPCRTCVEQSTSSSAVYTAADMLKVINHIEQTERAKSDQRIAAAVKEERDAIVDYLNIQALEAANEEAGMWGAVVSDSYLLVAGNIRNHEHKNPQGDV